MPSRTIDGLKYVVDMVTGICECPVGCDGSPCAHQYFLWANNIAESSNFIPTFSEEKRQQFAKVALGYSLPLSYYKGLHSLPRQDIDFQNDNVNNENNGESNDSTQVNEINALISIYNLNSNS